MPDLAKGELGAEGVYDVAFTGGALVFSGTYKGEQASLTVSGSVSAAQLIGALAAKVSNPAEKALLVGLESIIAAIP